MWVGSSWASSSSSRRGSCWAGGSRCARPRRGRRACGSVADAIRAAAAEESKETRRAGEIAGREEGAGAVVRASRRSAGARGGARRRQGASRAARQTSGRPRTGLAAAPRRPRRRRSASRSSRPVSPGSARRRGAVRGARAALGARGGRDGRGRARRPRRGELEDARMHAAQAVRVVDHAPVDEAARAAKRVMGIAVGRFSGHYLTERLHSLIPFAAGRHGQAVVGPAEANLQAIGGVAGVTSRSSRRATPSGSRASTASGREVARRCLRAHHAQPAPRRRRRRGRARRARAQQAARRRARRPRAPRLPRARDPAGARRDRRASSAALNYRTSYTQNQWKHAVEAAFLVRHDGRRSSGSTSSSRAAPRSCTTSARRSRTRSTARTPSSAPTTRAASARAEIVANAIGAHHADEPFNSAYAYLVAAADAMSRRAPRRAPRADESYAREARGPRAHRRAASAASAEAFAVQGGREVRIYVQEDRVDDLRAVELSTDIAQQDLARR